MNEFYTRKTRNRDISTWGLSSLVVAEVFVREGENGTESPPCVRLQQERSITALLNVSGLPNMYVNNHLLPNIISLGIWYHVSGR